MIRYIYTFFVALFLAIFVGLGIAVFYQAPTPPQAPVSLSDPAKDGSAQQSDMDAYNKKQQAYDKAVQRYDRNVSLVVLVFAIVLLVVALVLPKSVSTIADGILLGGIFTLLYGVGRGMTVDNNKYRFLVSAIGLAVTLILGYIKFGKQQPAAKR
jgi:hypothetical protein